MFSRFVARVGPAWGGRRRRFVVADCYLSGGRLAARAESRLGSVGNPLRFAPDQRGVREVYPCRAQSVTAARGAGAQSGSLPHVPACRRPRRRPGLQPQVRKDPLDHRRFENGRNDLQLATAVWAVFEVDLESEASAKTNLYSSYVAAKTRLSNRA